MLCRHENSLLKAEYFAGKSARSPINPALSSTLRTVNVLTAAAKLQLTKVQVRVDDALVKFACGIHTD